MQNQTPSPSQPDRISPDTRRDAASIAAILAMENGKAAENAAGWEELRARRQVEWLDFVSDPEAKIRCALAVWADARSRLRNMRSFVESMDKALDAQNALDKKAQPATMAGT